MGDPSFSGRSSTFLATTPASLSLKRCALAIVSSLAVMFCSLIAFARISLPRFEAFIPIFETGVALNSLLTASLLLAGFRRSRLCAVLCLASGYLFTSLIAVPLALTSAGVFANGSSLSAASQTGAWLDTFRNTGFPIFAIGYALLRRDEGSSDRSHSGTRAGIIWSAASTLASVCLLTLVATAGQQLLPPLMLGDGYTTAMVAANVPAWLLCLAVLAILGSRSPSILDLWVIVVVFGWMFDGALSMGLNTGRFDVGFYAGHVFGLLAASFVPIILLVEASRLYQRLDEARALAEERNTELIRFREELAQAQRLEAIGQLTGGVAHDFNNLLTVISGNLDLILGARHEADKIERLAQGALKAAQRGERLVRQLLTYARRQVTHPQTVNLNQLIVNIESLIRGVISEQIEVVTMLSPVLAPVWIDPAEFETAILNLIINSRDAIAGGGRVTIETRNMTVDQQYTADCPEVTPGAYVLISVSDTGVGMTPPVLARAFDPFFTTKEVGKGSGLGLSQVYGFAKMAGGHVKIDSEPGVGTTVKMYMPKSSDRAVTADLDTEAPSLVPVGSDETILVVEDDQDVLVAIAESLRDLGYEVVTAVDAAQALEFLEGDERVDLLLSDVIMPGGMNGAQLAVEARRLRPALKVLLTSGYTATALNREHGVPDNLNILEKPYRREELAKTLRLVIGR